MPKMEYECPEKEYGFAGKEYVCQIRSMGVGKGIWVPEKEHKCRKQNRNAKKGTWAPARNMGAILRRRCDKGERGNDSDLERMNCW